MPIQQITIIGTGLIGGSFALALKKRGLPVRIVGCDREPVLARAKAAGAIQPAGKLRPSPKPYSQEKDAENVTVIPPDSWTPGMRKVADYAKFLAQELMGVPVAVRFALANSTSVPFPAANAKARELPVNRKLLLPYFS